MYIRRKVFSVALDEYGEERYFSTNEIMGEEDYLDEVMYSDDEKSHLGRNIAIGTGAAAALGGGGIYAAKKIGKKMVEKNSAGQVGADVKKYERGQALQKPADWIVKKVKGGKALIVNKYTGAKQWVSAHKLAAAGIAVGTIAAGAGAAYGIKKYKEKQESYYDPEEEEYMFSKGDKESHTARNIALGAGGAAALGAGGIYGAEAIGKRMVEKNKGSWKHPLRYIDPKNRKRVKTGEKLQKPAQYVNAKAKEAAKWVKANPGKTAMVAVPVTALAGYKYAQSRKDD